jgi:hypothetical protein
MVSTVFNLLFGCRHRRLTRPITPAQKSSAAPRGAYVACLECGRQFHYDVRNMRMGLPVDATVVDSAAAGAKLLRPHH